MNTIQNISFSEYLRHPAVSRSELLLLRRSPAHYKSYTSLPRPESTDAQKIGIALHSAVLEPGRMQDMIEVRTPGSDFRTKEGKQWRDAVINSGKTIISREDSRNIDGMIGSIHAHPVASRLLGGGLQEHGLAEHTVIGEDAKTGLPLKCRPDFIPDETMFSEGSIPIVDLKTCEDASPWHFAKDLAGWAYYIQAAFYLQCCQSAGLTERT